MFMRIVKNGENTSPRVENPIAEHVHKAMIGLIDGTVAYLDLIGNKGVLTIGETGTNRVSLHYMDIDHTPENTHQYHWGVVLDPSLANDKRKIRVNYGTETTPEPICRTIPSEQALEITLYFLEHEAPPKGFTW